MADIPIPYEARALVHNPADKSLVLKSLPVPQATGKNDHLLRVHAVALTNGELTWPEPLVLSNPIPGYEVAGTVIAAPPVSPFPSGLEVYARTNFDRHGSARPFSIATTAELGHKPRKLSWEEAATVPLSALTAWQVLFEHGGLVPPDIQDVETARAQNAGKRVLVTAAAGGVGLWLVQLAQLAGAHVVGTCGSANKDFVLQLGAHEALDYRNTDLLEWVNLDAIARKFDIAGGKLISIVEDPSKVKPLTVEAKVTPIFFIVEANGKQLEQISKLIDGGTCKAYVDSVFDLQDGDKAMAKANGRQLRGKMRAVLAESLMPVGVASPVICLHRAWSADLMAWLRAALSVTGDGGEHPPHRHGGASVVGTVLAGSTYNKMNDEPTMLVSAGETWYEAPGCHHRVSMNASKTEELVLFATFVVETRVVEEGGMGALVQIDKEYVPE
ncbi:Reticulon-4-interacting protein 1 like protein [Paramyrothecium foliicola]|nr:Reticulon-4-interacting protein 1 like protein [Paramyrothecium foliicola]